MSLNNEPSVQEKSAEVLSQYDKLANDLLRTMRITTNARFEAAKRLKLINSICFLSTTLASLGLILIPLLDVAGHNKVFTNSSLTVFQIFLAVCVLVYSAAISTANFSVRSKEFLECGDKIKTIVNDFKLHLIDARDLDQPPLLKKYTELYTKVLIGTENHEDVDYLKSLALYDKKESSRNKDKSSDESSNWFDMWILNPIIYLFNSRQNFQTIIISNFKIYMPFIVLMILEVVFIGDMLGYWDLLEKFHKK